MEPTGQRMPRRVKGSVIYKHLASVVCCVCPVSPKLTAMAFSLSETLNSDFYHCCCTCRVKKQDLGKG